MTNFLLSGIFLSLLILLAESCLFNRERIRHHRTARLLQKQADRERLLYQLAQQIRQSLDLNEVLATTVEEVQQLLQVDLTGDNPSKRIAASGIAHKNHAENRAIYGA